MISVAIHIYNSTRELRRLPLTTNVSHSMAASKNLKVIQLNRNEDAIVIAPGKETTDFDHKKYIKRLYKEVPYYVPYYVEI